MGHSGLILNPETSLLWAPFLFDLFHLPSAALGNASLALCLFRYRLAVAFAIRRAMQQTRCFLPTQTGGKEQMLNPLQLSFFL